MVVESVTVDAGRRVRTEHAADPETMRSAMADYVRSVHRAYASGAAGAPPAARGRLRLYDPGLTVIAAGARNLHVVATTDRLAPPAGPEVA
ncbi:MAG: hypothetical protein ACRCZD_14935, partial [Phycicoccus sp.]